MARQQLHQLGAHGARVSVFREEPTRGLPYLGVEWREAGVRRSRRFPGVTRAAEREALAFATHVAQVLESPTAAVEQLTVRTVWQAFWQAHAPDWRPATRQVNAARWAVVEALLNPHTDATTIRGRHLDAVRTALLTTPRRDGETMARNQVAHHLQLVKAVWTWARENDLLPDNPLQPYRIRRGRDYTPLAIPEFQEAEWRRLLAALDYRDPLQWRVWVVVMLAGLLGTRANTLLKLQWAHVDWAARCIRWPARTDKLGRARVQPLPRDAMWALRVARVWQQREAPEAVHVFFGAQQRTRRRHWSYQAAVQALHRWCVRLEIPVVRYRAFHAFRRMRARSVVDATGNINSAAQWLGSVDLQTLKASYLRDRPGDLEAVVPHIKVEE